MPSVFVEPRPKGRAGEGITGYVVESHDGRLLGSFNTQEMAVAWAKLNGYTPLIARVRHLNDKDKPDHWRAG